jgi:hypothetical protein
MPILTLSNIKNSPGFRERPLKQKAPAQPVLYLHPETEFLIFAAAEGYGKEAVQALIESPGRAALEPLEAGLRIFLGEKPHKINMM